MGKVWSETTQEMPQPDRSCVAAAGSSARGRRRHDMDDPTGAFEIAVWAAAEGIANPDQMTLLEAEPRRWRLTLERLLDDTEDNLDAVRRLGGPEREQVVADFEEELARLEAAYDLLTRAEDPASAVVAADPIGEVRLQASWSGREVVVWAAGPATAPAGSVSGPAAHTTIWRAAHEACSRTSPAGSAATTTLVGSAAPVSRS